MKKTINAFFEIAASPWVVAIVTVVCFISCATMNLVWLLISCPIIMLYVGYWLQQKTANVNLAIVMTVVVNVIAFLLITSTVYIAHISLSDNSNKAMFVAMHFMFYISLMRIVMDEEVIHKLKAKWPEWQKRYKYMVSRFRIIAC